MISERATKAEIQIMLVSAQAAPNLLPALDPAWKPRQAILLASAKMRSRADALATVLREAGVTPRTIDLADEHDFRSIEAAMMGIAAEHEGGSVALNLTGGTKFMALAAQSVAKAAGWQMFYVDLDLDEVVWFDDAFTRVKLPSTLRLPHYLRAYGFTLPHGLTGLKADPRHGELMETLITRHSQFETAIGSLNRLAQDAERQRTLTVKRDAPAKAFDDLVVAFAAAGVLRASEETITFVNEPSRAFAGGGWLEHHVFQTVARLHGELGVRDKAANLKVWDVTEVENELDVAFLARNRLFVIECKTARMDGERTTRVKANDQLFKLAEVGRRVGGIGTRPMFVSYRRLGDAEERLARALGIEVVQGSELNLLTARIRAWVGH